MQLGGSPATIVPLPLQLSWEKEEEGLIVRGEGCERSVFQIPGKQRKTREKKTTRRHCDLGEIEQKEHEWQCTTRDEVPQAPTPL